MVPELRDSDQTVEIEVYEFDERLYATEDGAIVPHGDYRAVTLLGTPGVVMSLEGAKRLGLDSYKPTEPLVEPPREFPEEQGGMRT